MCDDDSHPDENEHDPSGQLRSLAHPAPQTIPPDDGQNAHAPGDDAACPPTDQRGFHRPIGLHCDIGATEAGPYVYLPLVLR